jgi:hypothetical protein
MKTILAEKPRMVQITDAAEIESIKRGGRLEINGQQAKDGTWWAYRYSVDRYRARQRKLQS